MALTRKFLAALGIEADKVDEIIEAHTETVNALKKERDAFKADAEKLPDVQKQLDDLKAATPDGETYKEQYDKLKQEYDDYKSGVKAKETKAKKVEAYRKLLKDAKVSEKRIDAILRVTDVDKIELDKDGQIKDAKEVSAKIAEEWADFIETEQEQGANTKTPPKGTGGASVPGEKSRAAQLAAQYAKNLYGISAGKGDNA